MLTNRGNGGPRECEPAHPAAGAQQQGDDHRVVRAQRLVRGHVGRGPGARTSGRPDHSERGRRNLPQGRRIGRGAGRSLRASICAASARKSCRGRPNPVCLSRARIRRAGACVLNPHGNKRVPPSARVRSYPVVEKHRALWIWMGDKPADPSANSRLQPARYERSKPCDETGLDHDQRQLRTRHR